jgi:signal peptidase I
MRYRGRGKENPMEHQTQSKQFIKSELLEEALSWAKMIVFAVVFALIVNNFVIVNASVPTGSMKNTIMEHDRIVAFRLSYGFWKFTFSEPKRYDIVVFRYPDNESILYVKRIVGLPGDRIEIKNGKVYRNGSGIPLNDHFIRSAAEGDYGPYTVPEGHYFMLGDNREDSQDSRFWINKYVSKEKILGKVVCRYYPGFKLLYNL